MTYLVTEFTIRFLFICSTKVLRSIMLHFLYRLLSHGILTLVAGAFCVQVLLILVRYDLGNTLVYMTFFRGYLGFMLATVGFVELNFILRYAQIHVWGCVKEINEDLAMTAIGISVLCVALATGYCETINLPIRNFFMSYSQCVFNCY